MIIRPELAALRADDAPQRRAQDALGKALAAWRILPQVQCVEADLGRWSAGAEIDDLPALAALFTAHDQSAKRFAATIVDAMAGVLVREPLGQSPLRHYCDDISASVTLLRHGTTVLSLLTIDGHRLSQCPAPTSARFAPTETFDAVLAGRAVADRFTLANQSPERGVFERETVSFEPGEISHRRGVREVLHWREVPSGLTLLRLQRRSDTCGIASEYALEDGALLHQAAGSPRDSRLELTAALLGRMGRRDAAPLLAAIAEEGGSEALRWQMLRECLALDTAEGFTVLCRLAADPADPLAGHAGALRAQLLESFPQLSGLIPCPAT